MSDKNHAPEFLSAFAQRQNEWNSKKQTEKQQKILDNAIRLFSEKGYANTSTSEIAKAAGVAEGTIFRHYGTKDNLLLSIILPFIKDSLHIIAEDVFNDILSANIEKFEDFLRAMLINRIQFIQQNKEIFQIVIKEVLYREELRKELAPHFSKHMLSRFRKVIDAFKEQGDLVDIPAETLLTMLLTTIGGYLTSRFIFFLDANSIDVNAEADNIVRFIMDGIRKST